MTFDEVLDQVRELLQSKGRMAYGALKRRFDLDDTYLEDLKTELIDAEQVVRDEDGKVLVWVGKKSEEESGNRGIGESEKKQRPSSDARPSTLDARRNAGERRQLTVQFIDLVGSTTLSQQLDPEDYHARVVAYQAVCHQVIARYEGHIAQYLGDGVLVYFGYPMAHEDDAARAVRAGLEIIAEMQNAGGLNPRLPSQQHDVLGDATEWRMKVGRSFKAGLQVRIGIHTGPVVVGEIGAGERTERLALGETPNIAARVQGQAEPDSVVMSAATYRLVQGLFDCHDLGPQALKGLSTPLSLYRVVGESAAQNRFEAAVQTGLTPLVGRTEELDLLQRRWMQAKDGAGQVVLLSGEPGIGKSRLVQELKEHISAAGATCIEFRCSPYHQNSALYPIIDHLQHLLQFAREDSPTVKIEKLQHTLSQYSFPQADTVPLLAALLSLPHPEGFPPITMSPQKQKEKTHAALVAWLVEEAEKAAVYCAWEDLHWADPSTLEVLTLLLDQAPTTRLLALLISRPEFTPPWSNRSHLSQVTLSRLGQQQVREMVSHVTDQAIRASTGSARTDNLSPSDSNSVRPELVEGRGVLPDNLIDAVVARTDGVPLFVEELTKSIVESIGAHGRSSLQFVIPATLQDSLMARLDRLGPTKEIAQLGATIGREFSYELLQAVSPLDEATLQHGLKQLVEVELIYQRGLPPQATYLFKHALIQDTAYQALLKSTRQHLHRQIAQVLAERFPEIVETQPELLAHHYTEAGLAEQALPYWQKAGERATQRSAYVEAISHLTKGLEVLKALPDTPQRVQQELTLDLALNDALVAVKGYTAPEVEKAVTRARALCQQLGETPQLFPVLYRLHVFYFNRWELQTSLELAKLLLRLAQSVQDRYLLSLAHAALGVTLTWLGEFVSARLHLEQAIALYDPQKHSHTAIGTADPRVDCLSFAAWTLWFLGYPDQALTRSQEAVALARGLSHAFSLAFALGGGAAFHLLRREGQLARERAEEVIALSTEQGFPYWLSVGTIVRGCALAEQGQVQEGIAQMGPRRSSYRATFFVAPLAAAYGKVGQVEEGLAVLAKALALVDKTGERVSEAELYRLKGTLTLQSQVESHKSKVKEQEAEECFLKAITIAQKQQAKSLELRAAMSLSRLWQQQGKHHAARDILSEIYGWFTEGFDTKDLQEAKALIEELSH